MMRIIALIAAAVIAWLIVRYPTDTPATGKVAAEPAKATTSTAPRVTCSVSDFAVEGFSSRVFDDCRVTPCPALKLTGKLKNKCTIPAGAQIKITAYDGKGSVVDTVDGWPASMRNIAPGADYAFDLGPLMKYRSTMKKFEVSVIDARSWR